LQVTLCDPYPSALSVRYRTSIKALYKSASFTFTLCVCIVKVGLAVFLRASQSSRADSISGVRCFFGVSGELRLELLRVPGAAARSRRVLPGTAPCLAFQIADRGVGGITARVVRPRSCDSDFGVGSSEDSVDFETTVELALGGVVTDRSYVAIKQSVPVGFAAVDQFTVSTDRPRQQ